MKTYKSLILGVSALLMASCHPALFEDVDNAEILVNKTENVSFNGNIVTVKKGTPLKFDLMGSPDFITFYSGETGHQYIYRNEGQFDAADVESVKLSFKLWSNFGDYESSAKGRLKVKYALEGDTDAFPGMSKENFAEDSVLVESFGWKELTNDEELITAATHSKEKEAGLFEKEIPAEWYGKKLTLAFVRNPQNDEWGAESEGEEGKKTTAVQSSFFVQNMQTVTKLKDGSTYVNYASTFCFTPLNMTNKIEFNDLKDKQFDVPANKEYGSTQRDVPGYCNLSTAGSGSFSIRGCGENEHWRYTWLVSDNINLLNRPVRDTGVKVKDISQAVAGYSYVYGNVGTYKATFVLVNSNFDDAEGKVQEFVINVVE